ncbi:MAG TPA: TIGR00725 family protein [Thermoanaerobaculia bacterium]|jgi:hypothetical protein|nr:TIGR00725 family protein [Thermoanaerobaculia bacterium]
MSSSLGAQRGPQIGVVGAAECGPDLAALATDVGAGLARAGVVLLTGGRSGVMAAASAGARRAGGLVIGVLPGGDAAATPPNPDVEVALFTGLGQARNQVLALSAAAVIAIGGGWGTLSEIAIALKHRVPVVALRSWRLARPDGAAEPLFHELAEGTAAEAVDLALALALGR